MLVRDLMEKKKLNLNQPILSVRRVRSTIASESDDKRKSTNNSLARLPPSGPVRVGAIPFQWEKTPGKPKDISVIENGIGSNVSGSQNVVSFDKKVILHESGKEGIEEKAGSDSDDGNESFKDARDTLSRTESFFMSGRMSGVYDDHEVQVQPKGSFLSDEKARDFMIDRFLPAAKAMISETHHYASKKPIVGQGQQKQLWKIGSTENSSPLNQHRLKSLRHKEGGVFEIDDSENYTTTCGLFPHFCLLNPVPAERMENEHSATRPPYQRGCGESLACESPAVEKTVYVDSVHKIKFQTNQKGDNFEALKSDSDINKNLSVDSLLENRQWLDDVNMKAALEAKILQSVDSPFLICSEDPSNGMQMETTNYSKKMDSELGKLGNQGNNLEQNTVLISSPKMDYDDSLINNSEVDIKNQPAAKLIDTVEGEEKIDLERQCGILGHQELSDATNFFEIPLVLPSLKAPSESWLKRTLPAISTRDASSKSKPCCKYLYKTTSLCLK
ncbi:unnamed protein product [Trifolium pratense]|uniref:Uncharacterized protein n=1 Tax=Trifolium pratense TaxID=57577 RepID=A0ACB0KTW3_TRIPR|nr:unnamed protein product [Trifolium pratense]